MTSDVGIFISFLLTISLAVLTVYLCLKSAHKVDDLGAQIPVLFILIVGPPGIIILGGADWDSLVLSVTHVSAISLSLLVAGAGYPSRIVGHLARHTERVVGEKHIDPESYELKKNALRRSRPFALAFLGILPLMWIGFLILYGDLMLAGKSR